MSKTLPSPEVSPAATARPAAVYEFRDFRLDCGRFELVRNKMSMRLERKPMELLILLVSREGQLVSRAEIAERLWSSEVFVDTEHGINTAIRKLRHLFRDDHDEPRFIQTVTGMGYRFVAPVALIAPVSSAAVPPPAVLPEPVSPLPLPALAAPAIGRKERFGWYAGVGACLLLVLLLGGLSPYLRHRPSQITYTQLTDFTDSAVSPALSPDGRIVAFIRGASTFASSDQIYVKMLPHGEARRVTDDSRPKYGLAFSPDGSELAYTVLEDAGFSTYEVSTLGGEPRLLKKNAAGLVWLDPQHLLFSEVKSGIHMGVVSATVNQENLREIYFPAHERGMAHYSYPSPDRRWALVVEMNGEGWMPCRLVSLVGEPGRLVGPQGQCTSAGWSVDGAWMYFTAAVEGRSHLWRQRFPKGNPEQITSGPTEEEGIAVDPKGHSLITSLGVHESAIWIHDGSGERPLSSEGEVVGGPSSTLLSADGNKIYYLLRRGGGTNTELWRVDVSSGKSEAVFPGISIVAYDISPDGRQAVYETSEPGRTTQLWLAPLDGSRPAAKVGGPGGRWPHFGARERILFEETDGNSNYLEQVNLDGSHHSKLFPYPVTEFQGISPGRRWVMAVVPRTAEKNAPAVMAIPLDGGTPRRICADYCFPRWSTNGKFLFVPVESGSLSSAGQSLAIPAGPGERLPDLLAGGIVSLADAGAIPGALLVDRAQLVPGKDPEHFAWVNTTAHRNLYRVSLP